MTIKELKEKRARLVKMNRREYCTRGNTQRCQELWDEIARIDDQLKAYREAKS